MNLSAGTRLGPYEILSPLGAGGMGEEHGSEQLVGDPEVPGSASASFGV